MSARTRQMKQDAKAARFDALVARYDDKGGDEHRRAAAHAHVMTHHALEMDTPEAHEAAAQAHEKVAEMHYDAAEECSESMQGSGSKASSGPDGPANGPKVKSPAAKTGRR